MPCCDRCAEAGLGALAWGGNFVYLSEEAGERRRQELMRQEGEDRRQVGATLESEFLPDELRAAIILFFSLLDEKQRRLYAGLEAAKLGHGGDRKMAELLDLAPQTVAKGRRQLLTGSVRRGRVRKAGGAALASTPAKRRGWRTLLIAVRIHPASPEKAPGRDWVTSVSVRAPMALDICFELWVEEWMRCTRVSGWGSWVWSVTSMPETWLPA